MCYIVPLFQTKSGCIRVTLPFCLIPTSLAHFLNLLNSKKMCRFNFIAFTPIPEILVIDLRMAFTNSLAMILLRLVDIGIQSLGILVLILILI